MVKENSGSTCTEEAVNCDKKIVSDDNVSSSASTNSEVENCKEVDERQIENDKNGKPI